MSEAKKLGIMQVFAVLNPDRYIKKSIQDGSLAIFDEEGSANRQVKSISDANDEECHIEELALCCKEKLEEYVNIHNEMYQMLNNIVELGALSPMQTDIISRLLTKARGNHESSR